MVDKIKATLKVKFNKDVPMKEWQIRDFLKELNRKLSGVQFTPRFLRTWGLPLDTTIQEIKITRRKKRQ